MVTIACIYNRKKDNVGNSTRYSDESCLKIYVLFHFPTKERTEDIEKPFLPSSGWKIEKLCVSWNSKH